MRFVSVYRMGTALSGIAAAGILLLSTNSFAAAQTDTSSVHTFFRVEVSPSLAAPVSGRLLIFLKSGSGDKEIDNDEMHPTGTWICAREVHDLKPGEVVEVDADRIAFPQPFSELNPGVYEAQAVLDVAHNYNYRGRADADWVSPVVTLAGWHPGSAAEPELVLDRHPPQSPEREAI